MSRLTLQLPLPAVTIKIIYYEYRLNLFSPFSRDQSFSLFCIRINGGAVAEFPIVISYI